MRVKTAILAAAFFVAAANSPAVSSSPADSAVWRLVEQGKIFLTENKLKEAEQSFKQALKKDRHFAAAMAGLGQYHVAKEEWGDANDWFEKVLAEEPENLEAMYHRGICFRETGKFKVLLLRKLDWDNSAKYFKRVLAKDSLFSDTLYQYAQLLRYRDKFTEAILLGHHQIRLSPALVSGQRGLFRLYNYFLDNRSEEEVIAWLQANDSEHARYFLGEVYRRAEKLALADSLFWSWVSAMPAASMIPAYLSLARLHLQRQQPQTTERLFWHAVDGIRNQIDAELIFEDVKYIVSETELRTFRQLASPAEYVAFFYRFWNSRDPLPAADNNVRLIEHYRRLIYAEQHYRYDRFRTWANNPDKLSYLKFPVTHYLNDRFNDKGLIYIRHGEPNERVMTVNPDVESWRYNRAPNTPELIFHFVVDEEGAGHNWRLTPYVDHERFWEDRATWGSLYQRRLRNDPMDRMTLEDEVAQQSRQAAATGFNTDRHSWDKNVQPLNAPSYTAFFKAPEGKSYFDLYYGLPLPSNEELSKKPETKILCEHGLTLHDMGWNRTQRLHDEVPKELLSQIGQQQFLVGQYHFMVKPDSYHVAFYVRQPATERLGAWKDALRVPKFSEDRLDMSSIVLASSVTPADGGDPLAKNGLRITPNPFKYFPRSQPVYIYFEIYNLQPDAEGTSSFVIEYTTLLRKAKKTGAKKVFGLFGSKSKPSTTLVAEREAKGSSSAEYLALDLGRAGKGDFRLSVKITDKKSGQQSEGFIDFALF